MRCSSLNSTLPTSLARLLVSEHGLGGFDCTRDIPPGNAQLRLVDRFTEHNEPGDRHDLQETCQCGDLRVVD